MECSRIAHFNQAEFKCTLPEGHLGRHYSFDGETELQVSWLHEALVDRLRTKSERPLTSISQKLLDNLKPSGELSDWFNAKTAIQHRLYQLESLLRLHGEI